MAQRSVHYRDYGVTIEIPEGVARVLRRIRRAPARGPAAQLVVFPPPPTTVETRARERAAAEALAAEAAAAVERLQDGEVVEHRWYHTIELPGGRVTAGRFDHRQLLPYYGLPDDLHGRSALDVGSGDGFWAFELERRGARVTSVDIETFAEVDLPPALHQIFVEHPLNLSFRRGLDIAQRELASQVKLVNSPIYDIDPDAIGRFDFVHAGDILLHLRDPALALQRLCAVTSGQLLLADCFDPDIDALGGGPGLTRYRGGWEDATWWAPALSTLVQMVADAGFTDVEVLATYRLAATNETKGPWRAVIRAFAAPTSVPAH